MLFRSFHEVTDAILTIRASGDQEDHDDAFEALRDFEDWYRARGGGEFFALFDVYVPETPRVDF